MESKKELVIQIPDKPCVMVFTKHGNIKRRSIRARKWVIPERNKRGKVTIFSRSSARRLRESLIKIPSKVGLYGVTLTFKESCWKDYLKENPEEIRQFFKALMEKMRNNAKKGYICPRFYTFWRVELQKNKTPHFHLVIYTEDVKDILIFRDAFFRTVEKRLKYCCPDNAFDMRELSGYSEAFSYICSHTSKHKKEQLGWQGRQWGIIFPCKEAKDFYKSASVSVDNASYELNRRKEVEISRALRKLHWSKLRSRLIPVKTRKEIISRQHLPSNDPNKLKEEYWQNLSKNCPRFYCFGRKNKRAYDFNRFVDVELMHCDKSSKFKHLSFNNKSSKRIIRRGSLRFFTQRLSSVSSQFVTEDTNSKLIRIIKNENTERPSVRVPFK